MTAFDDVRSGDGRSARYGIEPFDVGYGASFAAEGDSPFDIECEVVEDGGILQAHHPQPWVCPGRLAFVDGTMRTDARLTRTVYRSRTRSMPSDLTLWGTGR
jgi:hypothetical protein